MAKKLSSKARSEIAKKSWVKRRKNAKNIASSRKKSATKKSKTV